MQQLMLAFVGASLLVAELARGGEVLVQWALPDINERGEPLLDGELQRIEVVFWRSNETPTRVNAGLAEAISISGLRPGPWFFYSEAISHCVRAEPGGVIAEFECHSTPTPTQRVQVKN